MRSATKCAAARSTSPRAPNTDKRLVRLRQKIPNAFLGAVDAQLGDECGFAQRRVGAGRFAERSRVAFDIEKVVGDLEGFAERAAVSVERLIIFLRGLAEQRAGDAAVAEQRARLHLLHTRHVDRLAVAEAAFAGEIEKLPADHAANAGSARQRTRQQQANGCDLYGSRRG